MRLSILVVSRTPSLLKGMLASIKNASSLSKADLEILCSWNGTAEGETAIVNNSTYNFSITQRVAYHFASNMNTLVEAAKGDLILFINDDLILDSGSIDAAIKCLDSETNAGIVGGRLRNERGGLQHGGILFDDSYSPYHYLENLLNADEEIFTDQSRLMPAVTGAMMLIKKDNFLKLNFNSSYKVCGEDIELCLDLRQILGLNIFYCPEASGVHLSSVTREKMNQFGDNQHDMQRMRLRRQSFLEQANKAQLKQELAAVNLEAKELRKILLQRADSYPEKENWKDQCHALQLTRLRQQEEIALLKKAMDSEVSP